MNHINIKLPQSVILTLLISLLFTFPAFADEMSAKAPASETRVDEAMTDTHAQQIFELAMEERDSGKVYDAIEKFEYILTRRPSLNRARLELAVSYHRAHHYEKALSEFQAVLDDPETPEKVRLAILAYLGQLTSDEAKPKTEHSFSYYTRAGMLYNSNINFAPLRGTDFISDGQDTASPGLDTFLTASHRYKDNQPFNIAGAATNFEWQSQVSWTGNNYTRNSDFNLNVLSASTGPAFISTGRWNSSINIQVDQTYFGGSTLGTFISLNPILSFDMGNYRGILLELSYTDNNFTRPQDKDRDGRNILGGAAFSTLLGEDNNGLEVGFRLTDQTANDEQFGYESAEIYFGGFMTFAKASNVYLNLNFEEYEYNAADTLACAPQPCIGSVRDEIESRYVLGYNYNFSNGFLQGWLLDAHISYIRNNSNIDFYKYEQKIITINLARYFI
jgi:tetratricopeptide (TPR) repeat protein